MRFLRASVGVAVILSISAAAATGSADAPHLRFSTFSARVLPGNKAVVSVADTKPKDVCTLHVTYPDGSKQPGLPKRTVVAQRASWSWTIPAETRAGSAQAAISCRSGGKLGGRIVIVGEIPPALPEVDVVKQGFSTRTGSGSTASASISYGIVLTNKSTSADAVGTYVLVNFVNGNGVLLGSQSTTVRLIRAGGDFALGNTLSFTSAPSVTKLEVVVRVGGKQAPTTDPPVSLANVRVAPDASSPGWVGSVEGEIVNGDASHTMVGADFSGVVLDGGGNIIGGGYGSTPSGISVPSGARAFFTLTTGFTSIPMANAERVQLSVAPRYE
jgi:hypothetical protein